MLFGFFSMLITGHWFFYDARLGLDMVCGGGRGLDPSQLGVVYVSGGFYY